MTLYSEGPLKEVYIFDLSGKILQKLALISQVKNKLDLSNYPDGLYFIACPDENVKFHSKRIILNRNI